MGRSTTTAVLVEGARAYASGAVLRMAIVTRRSARHLRRRMMSELDVTHGRGTLNLALPPGGLRWGFEYADGRRVTTLDPSPWTEIPEDADPQTWEPRRPVMQPLNAPRVYGPTWRRDVWLWPLPPAGDLRAVCAWPDEGIEETRTTLDATALRAAARDARPLWPGTPVELGHADRPAPEETEARRGTATSTARPGRPPAPADPRARPAGVRRRSGAPGTRATRSRRSRRPPGSAARVATRT